MTNTVAPETCANFHIHPDELVKKRIEGTLLKFTNVVKGYQCRYFILDPLNGTLNYYEKKEHTKNKARGVISLTYASISSIDEDPQGFMITTINGEIIRLRANTPDERSLWVNNLTVVCETHCNYALNSARQNSAVKNNSIIEYPDINSNNATQPVETSIKDQSKQYFNMNTDTSSTSSENENSNNQNSDTLLNELLDQIEKDYSSLSKYISMIKLKENDEFCKSLLIAKSSTQAALANLLLCREDLFGNRDNGIRLNNIKSLHNDNNDISNINNFNNVLSE